MKTQNFKSSIATMFAIICLATGAYATSNQSKMAADTGKMSKMNHKKMAKMDHKKMNKMSKEKMAKKDTASKM